MTEDQWEDISSRVRAVLNYGVEQKERLNANRMARFVAAVPFLAGCPKASETSFVHLLVYLVSLDEAAQDIFSHRPADDADVYSRLFPILSFSGGDEAVLACCRDLMALCMVANYCNDAATDTDKGKYNPVVAGIWNAEQLTASLKASISGTITPEIEAWFSISDALRGVWA